jgi:hypothetical protein
MVHGMTAPGAPESRGAGSASDRIEEALRRGLLASDADAPPASEDLDALRAVARTHKGEPFALAPVCVELVRAMLRSCFGPCAKSEDALDPIARRVAETLFDDPFFKARMESLWMRLCEETP